MSTQVFYFNGDFVSPYRLTPETIDPRDYKRIVTVDEDGREVIWRRMNVVDGNPEVELPLKLRCRSMCVGDVVLHDNGEAWMCAGMGWSRFPANAGEAFKAAHASDVSEKRS